MALCACGCGKQHYYHDGGHGGVLLGPDESVVKVVVPGLGSEPGDYDDNEKHNEYYERESYEHDDYDDDDDYDFRDLLPMIDVVEDVDMDVVDLPHARKVDRSNVEGWPVPEDRDGTRTMIALRVPPKVGGRYGRDAEHIVDLEPLQDRHITLLNLGRKSPEERSRLHEVLRRWMSQGQWQPLEGEAQGWGTFTKPRHGNRNALWMGWNIPGLAELRHDLKEHLAGEGFDCSSDYDFVPHETIGYSDDIPGVLPVFPEQPVEHTFDGLIVGEDDEWTEYPFHTGLVLASGRAAVVAALEAAVDDEVAAMSDAELDALIAGGGLDRNRGNAEKLRRYWTIGPGGAKIRWNTKGDWKRCVKYLSKHMGPRAKGYCFSGDTEFLTRDGVMTFADAVGTRQFVLTQASPIGKRSSNAVREDGYWVEAPIESFGEQRVLTVTLRRNKVRKEIRATPEHKWFAAPNGRNIRRFDIDVVTTEQLTPGMTLTALSAFNDSDLIPSPDGIRAGFVFGDGHRQSIGTTRVDVWGDKQGDVLRYYDGYPMREVKAQSGLIGTRVQRLPAHLKELPATDDLPYLAGWLAGYIAADGSASPSGSLTLSSKDEEHLQFARHAAELLGIVTGPIETTMRKGYGEENSPLYRFSFMSRTVPHRLVLRSKHRAALFDGRDHEQLPMRWVVESVEDRGEVEEVFCAVVPGTESFVLTDNIWVHNCTLRHKEMTGLHTGSMAHRIRFGWGGKPGSYWAKVAAENSINASAGLSMVFGMHGERVVVPMSGDPADPLVRLLGGDLPQQVEFRIPLLLPEGVESGDGRTFEKGVVDVRDTPIPLLWQPNSMQGHDGAVIVGRIDRVERTDDGIGNCHGVFDTSPMAMEAVRMIRDGFLRGVSADLDKFEAKILGKGSGVATAGKKSAKKDDDDVVAPDKMSIKSGRIMAATLVAKPAFEQAKIELVEGGGPVESQVEVDGAVEPVVASAGEVIPDGVYRGALGDELRASAAVFVGQLRKDGYDRSLAQFSALVASGADGGVGVPAKPPAEWFENPGLPKPTHLTITDEGRVFGHIAAWHVDHIGMGFGTRPPKSKSNYAYFRTGLLRTAEGNDIRVGQLTLAGGHASLQADAQAAVKHYDDTNSAFADVVAGEDRHGIWVSGALRPGVTETQLRVARASSPSGDWRPINGRLELVAVCQVNVPGFPVVEARVASGAVVALVAAGTSPLVASMVGDEAIDEFAVGEVLLPGDLAADEFAAMPDLSDGASGLGDVDVYASIVDAASLAAAVGEFVCKTGKKKTKKGIVLRAQELGLSDSLPDGWVDEVLLQPQVAAVEAARAAAAAAEASVLEHAFLSAKARMLRSRIGEPAAGFVASGDSERDDDAVLDEVVRGLTIREAAALLFAAQREAEESEAAEAAALTAAVEAGEALADGSWWIRDDADVRGAVESFGGLRGTRERRVVQNHIKRRARELGAAEFVPNWWWSPRESAVFSGEGVDVSGVVESAIQEALEAEFAKLVEEGGVDGFDVDAARAQLAADFGVAVEIIDPDDMYEDEMYEDGMEHVEPDVDEMGGPSDNDMDDMEPDVDEMGGPSDNDMDDMEPDVDEMGGPSDNDMDDMYAADGVTAAAGELADVSPVGAVLSKQPVSTERRKVMAKKGTAMPGGKFPIADVEDLKRAIKAYGRAKESDRAAVRRHIIKRARALGKMDLIPDSWPKR